MPHEHKLDWLHQTQSTSAAARACREGRLVHAHTQTYRFMDALVAETTGFFSPFFTAFYSVASEQWGEMRAKGLQRGCYGNRSSWQQVEGPDGYLAATPECHWLQVHISVEGCELWMRVCWSEDMLSLSGMNPAGCACTFCAPDVPGRTD